MAESKTRPVIGTIAGSLAGLLTACLLSWQLGTDDWSPERGWLIAVVGGGIGSLAGTLVGTLFRPRLGAYWLWFLLAVVVLGFLPWATVESGPPRPLWTAWLRLDTDWILLHWLVASLAATGLTTVLRLLTFHRQPESLRQTLGWPMLLMMSGGLVAVLALLAWLGASPVVFALVLAPLIGNQLVSLAVGFWGKLIGRSRPVVSQVKPA